MDDELRPSEVARQRRRDRDATAVERAGMRTGLAKGMKQIMDAQARRAAEARDAIRARQGTPDGEQPDGSRPDSGRSRTDRGNDTDSRRSRPG